MSTRLPGIICSDAAAEAARYRFTAVDRPEGFLGLAIVSLGDQVAEVKNAPEDTKSLEEGKIGVKGLGKKKTDESEHFIWKDDPKQTSIRFLIGVKYEEQGVIMYTEE